VKSIPRTIFIISGSNGVGKTTLAKELLEEFNLYFLNADEIAASLNPRNVSLVRLKAGRIYNKKMRELLEKGTSFALETTLSGKSLFDFLIEAKIRKYSLRFIYFFVDTPEVALDRIQLRIKKGGHDVPKDDVVRRFYRSRTNFWHTYKEIADDWTIFYNGQEKLVIVADGNRNDYSTRDQKLFNLFKKDVKIEK